MKMCFSESFLKSGFDTPANYIGTFKHHFGITPKQYSRNRKNRTLSEFANFLNKLTRGADYDIILDIKNAKRNKSRRLSAA